MYVEIEGDEAKLYGTIWNGDGPYVSSLLTSFLKGKTDATIRLHTPGGSVIDGNLIYNTIIKSKVNIHIVVDGLAASMGSIIMLAGNKISIADNALVMIHAPSGDARGTADDFTKVAKVLKTMENTFIKAYARKTGREEEELRGWMKGDNWFSAEEAVAEKLVDEVIPSVFDELDIDAMSEYNLVALSKVFEQFDQMRAAADSSSSPKTEDPKTQSLKVDTMKLNAKSLTFLGLNEKSTDEEINQAVASLEQRVSDSEKRANDAESALEAKNAEQVTALINKAVAEGRVLPADKEKYEKLAKTDLALASEMIEKLPAKENLSGGVHQAPKAHTIEGRENWTFKDWSKNDTAGLLKMKQDDPEAYKALAEKSGVKLY